MFKSQKGFTLIELLAVIAVIAIIACLLLPALSAARERNRQKQGITSPEQQQTINIYSKVTWNHAASSFTPLNFSEEVQLYIYITSPSDGKVLAVHETHSKLSHDYVSDSFTSLSWLDKNKVFHRQFLTGVGIEVTDKPLQTEGGYIIRENKQTTVQP